MIHYEVESQLNPRYNEVFDMRYYHGIYRVVKMDDDAVVEVIKTFDSPNGGWNNDQAWTLCGNLSKRWKDVD